MTAERLRQAAAKVREVVHAFRMASALTWAMGASDLLYVWEVSRGGSDAGEYARDVTRYAWTIWRVPLWPITLVMDVARVVVDVRADARTAR